MYFKQFYLGCLAQASYLIGADGEAAVVDPRRDVDEYLDEARAQGLRIRYVIETHLHADFVSGHRELSERTGATIVIGEKAAAEFPHHPAKEGDELRLGSVLLRILETPGHTPESLSILVIDTKQSEKPRMVLTGDTLFIGDVGRPDLAGARGLTPEAMAGMLYDSLHRKLLTLDDAVEVYPAHGAGSLCGKNLSKETSSTIGDQRRFNYALTPMSKAEFVRMLTTDLPEVPRYFPMSVEINRTGAAAAADKPLPPALGPAEFRARAERGARVLDVRDSAAFGNGHVPGALNIGLRGQFASWAGTLIDNTREILIVADDDSGVREAVMRLLRVGLENVVGYLASGMRAWDAAGFPVVRLPQIAVDELREWLRQPAAGLQVLDVRRAGEWQAGHVPGAVDVPLDRLEKDLRGLDPARRTAVICAGGYRSSAAASLLEQHGFKDLYNVIGGTSAWIAAGYDVEKPA
jgi:glyoxylase-like metal-dependent hydrolase (beta-lactamase superfamily II)/3-mercaptopyruvate sulfurtransferase SseA